MDKNSWDVKVDEIVERIDNEVWESETFDENDWYFFLHPYKFYVSGVEVYFVNIMFNQASFVICDRTLISMKEKCVVKSFKEVVEQLKVRIKEYFKKMTQREAKFLEFLDKNICNRSEEWVKEHGM